MDHNLIHKEVEFYYCIVYYERRSSELSLRSKNISKKPYKIVNPLLSSHIFVIFRIQDNAVTMIQSQEEKSNLWIYILCGIIVGILILALLTYVLYRVGIFKIPLCMLKYERIFCLQCHFFDRKLRDKMNDDNLIVSILSYRTNTYDFSKNFTFQNEQNEQNDEHETNDVNCEVDLRGPDVKELEIEECDVNSEGISNKINRDK